MALDSFLNLKHLKSQVLLHTVFYM